MFRRLLGVQAVHLYAVRRPDAQSPADARRLLWTDVFEALDVSAAPPCVREWLQALPR